MRVKTSYMRWAMGVMIAFGVSGAMAQSAVAQPAFKPTPRSVVAIPTIYQSIPVKAQFCSDDVIHCGRRVLESLPAPYTLTQESGAQGQDEEFHFRNNVVVYLLTMNDLQDDSIRAERYRVSFKKEEAGLRLVQVGRQNQCARGKIKGWTKRLCP